MSEQVNVQAKKQLAKLLATENITVVHAGTRTATFDPKRRILTLPIWENMSGDLYDLLVLHEVGHALFTPSGSKPLVDACNYIDPQYPASAKSFVNVVEDARIEKLIKRRYPGSRGNFIRGYKELVERDFFKTKHRDMKRMNIIDRINIHFKAGLEMGIEFTDEEMKFVQRLEDALTFDEVVELAKELYTYAKLERSRKKKLEEQAAQADDMECGDEDNEDDDCEAENDKGSKRQNSQKKKVATPKDDEDGDDEIDPDIEDAGLPPEDDTDVDVEGDDDEDCEDSGDEKASGKGEEDDADEDSNADSGGDGSESDESEEDGEEPGDDDAGTKGSGDQSDADDSEEEEIDDSPVTSETDEAWNETQDDLRDKNAKPILYLDLPKPKLDKIIIPFKTVHRQIREFYVKQDQTRRRTFVAQHISEFDRFKAENKPVVDWLLKEFEMYKAADQYARTQTSTSGILDTNRLHMYKVSDDIMKRTTIVPGGKNHALQMFVDFSGSMKEHILGTVHQMLNFAMFARKAQFPFRVYTYGMRVIHSTESISSGSSQANKDVFEHGKENYAFYVGFALREMLSDKMNAKEFNDAGVNLIMLASGGTSGYSATSFSYVELPPTDQMHGTPLNETITCAMDMHFNLKKETGAQFIHSVFLTDGESTTNGHYTTNQFGSTSRFPNHTDIYLRDSVTKLDFQLNGEAIHDTNQFLRMFRERTKSRAIGFFICDGESEEKKKAFRQFMPQRAANEMDKIEKELDENFFTVATESGYNEFYILPAGRKLKIAATGSGALAGAVTNAQIVTAFTNHGLMQRKQRPLLTRFIKLIS